MKKKKNTFRAHPQIDAAHVGKQHLPFAGNSYTNYLLSVSNFLMIVSISVVLGATSPRLTGISKHKINPARGPQIPKIRNTVSFSGIH